jgi:hypothetical protein
LPVIDQGIVNYWVARAANAANPTARGRAWQHLACYSFRRIPGVSIFRRNVIDLPRAREFDVAFRNVSPRIGFGFLAFAVLVECKYQNRPVSSADVSWFANKMRDRALSDGILFSKLGLSGDPARWTSAYDIVREARRQFGLKILSVSLAELQACGQSSDLVRLCLSKWLQVTLAR